jgi:hypothetical protein
MRRSHGKATVRFGHVAVRRFHDLDPPSTLRRPEWGHWRALVKWALSSRPRHLSSGNIRAPAVTYTPPPIPAALYSTILSSGSSPTGPTTQAPTRSGSLPLKPLAARVPVSVPVLRRFAEGALERCLAKRAFRFLHSSDAYMRVLSQIPGQRGRPPPRSSITRADAYNLAEWGLLESLPRQSGRRVFAALFSVPKSDGKWSRLIADARPLNAICIQPPKFCIPSPRDVVSAVQSNPWGYSADFKNWFYLLPVPRAVRHLFAARAGKHLWQFTRLPMGWKWAPFIAHSVTCVLAGLAITQPSQTGAAVLDNVLLLDISPPALAARIDTFRDRAKRARAIIGEQSTGPSLSFTHAGIAYRDRLWSHKAGWALSASQWLTRFSRSTSFTPLGVAKATGLALWALRVADGPIDFIRPLLRWLSRAVSSPSSDGSMPHPCSHVPPSTQALQCIRVVAAALAADPTYRRIPLPSRSIRLWTDASVRGGGAVLQDGDKWCTLRWTWSRVYRSADISMLEAVAALRSLQWAMGKSPGPMHIKLLIDNSAVVSAIQAGGSANSVISEIAGQVWTMAAQSSSRVSASWVSTKSNLADAPSRGVDQPLPPPPGHPAHSHGISFPTTNPTHLQSTPFPVPVSCPLSPAGPSLSFSLPTAVWTPLTSPPSSRPSRTTS